MIKKLMIAALALAAWGPAAAIGQTAPADAAAPPSIESRVALVCTSCHSAQAYSSVRGTRAEWRRHVYEMMLHGAQIRPEEVEPITAYLASTYGREEPEAAPAPRPQAQARPAPAPVRVAQADTQREALVNRVCSSCHAMSLVTAARRTPADWNSVITRMQGHGAQMSPAERQSISAYLNEHYGR